MEFFQGFKWAVPAAFKDAIARCCFTLGDVLYDTPLAYEETWDEAKKHIKNDIQVLSPGRLQTQTGTFLKNWQSPIRLTLNDYKRNTKTAYDTTQGRLFTLLWRGDPQVLDNRTEEPSPPRSLQDAKKVLPSLLSRFKEVSGAEANALTLFIIPYDTLNETSLRKDAKLSVLLRKIDVSVFELPADVPSKPESGSFMPTMTFKCFATPEGNKEEFVSIIKKAVYVPGANTETQKFDIKKHGLLV